MANTYSQLNIHCVFSVKGHDNVLSDSFRDRLFQFMGGIIRQKRCFPLAVGGWKDHVHIFFELSPDEKISDVLRDVKSASSRWVNEHKLVTGHFAWQEGYGAFSHSRSQRDQVIKYIQTQEEHHKRRTFREEYLDMLQKAEIEFDERYVFEFYG
jgi:putative transposase